MSFEKKIQEMGLELPPLPKPVANYVPGLEVEGLYISGQGPRDSNGKFMQGIVGHTLTIEEAYQHAGRPVYSCCQWQSISLGHWSEFNKL